ncbi:gluconolaconase [Rhodococcus sp. WWJCD1]|uniref:SMP-30/gluconolactonase/LRE family protein n=1 Tax=Rhodococcus sp. WWJCD1 TaxID=2022519 RepID=UPI000B9B4C7F|nr:SMP-30/gluconolactonase/LRE family protein [Rhodococcus sp. WWJCD1]OZC45767.1 gluconolaconase [Rhodococcus sp. WWJCD1]
MTLVGEWAPLSDARYELGEGARASDGGFVFVDLLAGALIADDGSMLHNLDVPLGAVAPRTDGGWIAAAGNGIAFLDRSGGEIEWVADLLVDALVPMRMNDGVADPHGRFWAGAMPYGDHPGTGFLVRVDVDGSIRRVLDGLTIPNGPAFSADGSVMYLAESSAGLITRYDVADNGHLLAPTVFAEVGDASPDGMTVDADGYLWSALWGGHRLHRYAPDGGLEEIVPVPAAQPTSIALASGRILVTTATTGLDAPGPWDGATLVASTTVAGVPTAMFGG